MHSWLHIKNIYQTFAGLDIFISHGEPALLRNVEVVQVGGTHSQPLNVRGCQIGAIIGHVHTTCHAQTHQVGAYAMSLF
jgi:hypothetical protein